MAVEEGLFALITGDAGVAELIGARLYPNVVPADADLPAASYQRISGPRTLAHDGPTGLAEGRFQITATAATYGAASGVIEAIRQAVDGYQGTVGGIEIEGISVENEYDGYNQTTVTQTKRLDVLVVYLE